MRCQTFVQARDILVLQSCVRYASRLLYTSQCQVGGVISGFAGTAGGCRGFIDGLCQSGQCWWCNYPREEYFRGQMMREEAESGDADFESAPSGYGGERRIQCGQVTLRPVSDKLRGHVIVPGWRPIDIRQRPQLIHQQFDAAGDVRREGNSGKEAQSSIILFCDAACSCDSLEAADKHGSAPLLL